MNRRACRFEFRNISAVAAYSCAFAAWGFTFHALTGEWLYPFLDTSASTAPLAYLAIYAMHWLFFGLFAAGLAARTRFLWKEGGAKKAA